MGRGRSPPKEAGAGWGPRGLSCKALEVRKGREEPQEPEEALRVGDGVSVAGLRPGRARRSAVGLLGAGRAGAHVHGPGLGPGQCGAWGRG